MQSFLCFDDLWFSDEFCSMIMFALPLKAFGFQSIHLSPLMMALSKLVFLGIIVWGINLWVGHRCGEK